MRQFKVKLSKTSKHYTVQELGDDRSVAVGPPKELPARDLTAEQILDLMFEDDVVGSRFFSEKVINTELPKANRAPHRMVKP